MTYQEAEKFIKDNTKGLLRGIVGSKPFAHAVEGALILPNNAAQEQKYQIAIEHFDNGKPNREVIFNMGFDVNDVGPFVLIKMRGYSFIMPVSSYLKSDLCQNIS